MKTILPAFLVVMLTVCFSVNIAGAQDITADPGAYMTAINNAETNMNKAYMTYISAAAHSTRKKKGRKVAPCSTR